MNYTLNCPSLEHIALVEIATTLWNQDDIRSLMSKFNFPLDKYDTREKWQEIENKVIEKVQHLSLPKSLKEEILGFIKPVGLQILEWKEYHQEKSRLCIGLPSELCWTPQGTVDLKKTAEALIKDESLDVISRYKLACSYCFEDDVLELWNKIPENRRKSLYSSNENPIKVGQQDLVVLWMYNINDKVNKLDDSDERDWWQQERSRCSLYQYAFQYAAEDGNIAATEYFFQKLTSREREESLVRTADNITNSYHLTAQSRADVLCFLLSKMDEEKQIAVFIRRPDQVLKCLLEWPWQNLFMGTANRMWDFLDEGGYHHILSIIVSKVRRGHKDYDYQKLFREFWQLSPNDHKRYVINGYASGILLSSLLKIEDNENVKLILKDATLTGKRKLIFSDMGQFICQDFIRYDEWDLLRFFIRECISSKDEMIKFEEEFEERLTWRCSKEEFAKKKDKFIQLLDDFINGYNKRKSVVEVDSSPAKRLHSTEFEKVTHSLKK